MSQTSSSALVAPRLRGQSQFDDYDDDNFYEDYNDDNFYEDYNDDVYDDYDDDFYEV